MLEKLYYTSPKGFKITIVILVFPLNFKKNSTKEDFDDGYYMVILIVKHYKWPLNSLLSAFKANVFKRLIIGWQHSS